ncbi:hypothetical protein [Streptomyces sp. NPDC097619]|uniref:hypothetical protein n=1 Tax=Streptomyces sp. NPDC097619 TaxID=3157228 RepID=UPI0033324B8B
MNLRMAAIGAGVLIVLSVPLAGALAGPVGGVRGEGGLLPALGLSDSGAKNPGPGPSEGPVEGAAASPGTAPGDDPSRQSPPARAPRPAAAAPGAPADPDARCGPELSSPEGVEAQTCVLSGREGTWARSYYRNTTGHPLDAVLSLMGPAGRVVQIHCAVAAGDEPGVCETPKQLPGPLEGPAQRTGAAWTAVAEYAVPDDRRPLLLRAGSNSGDPVEG